MSSATKSVSSSGIEILRDLVANYPYVVQLLIYVGVVYGIWLIKRALELLREKASAGIGIGQSEKELGKKAQNNLIFGIVFINFLWFTQLIMNTLGIGIDSTVKDPTDYINRDIFESAENASDLLMYVIWTVNIMGFWWLFRGTYILRASIDNPHKYEKWVGIKLYVAAIMALNIKLIMINITQWMHLDFIAKWLGVS